MSASTTLSYAAITPARDEADNLRRLAHSLVRQTRRPAEWIVVDGGSKDETATLLEELAASQPWIRRVEVPREPATLRGGPIVRAFLAGLPELETKPDVVVKLDADVSMEPDYFERLLSAFASDARLGMASGSAWEERAGVWQQRHMTRSSVWGACRAYRSACLDDVLPLEDGMGWDSIDEFKANLAGWTTRTLLDVPFRHHRAEGTRDGAVAAWRTQGALAHYLGYRPWYLAARAVFRGLRDPAALAMLYGFADAAVHKRPRYSDPSVRRYLREQQSLRQLPKRAREALGRPSARARPAAPAG